MLQRWATGEREKTQLWHKQAHASLFFLSHALVGNSLWTLLLWTFLFHRETGETKCKQIEQVDTRLTAQDVDIRSREKKPKRKNPVTQVLWLFASSISHWAHFLFTLFLCVSVSHRVTLWRVLEYLLISRNGWPNLLASGEIQIANCVASNRGH